MTAACRHLFKQQFHGIMDNIKLCCCKKRQRSKREKNIVANYKKLHDVSEKATLVSQTTNFITHVSEPAIKLSQIYSLFTNFILIYQIYEISMKNLDNPYYKAVVIVQGVALTSLYLIAYSTINYSIYINGGPGTNMKFEN